MNSFKIWCNDTNLIEVSYEKYKNWILFQQIYTCDKITAKHIDKMADWTFQAGKSSISNLPVK